MSVIHIQVNPGDTLIIHQPGQQTTQISFDNWWTAAHQKPTGNWMQEWERKQRESQTLQQTSSKPA